MCLFRALVATESQQPGCNLLLPAQRAFWPQASCIPACLCEGMLQRQQQMEAVGCLVGWSRLCMPPDTHIYGAAVLLLLFRPAWCLLSWRQRAQNLNGPC